MSDQSHPVTLGDLRVAFEDGWQLNSISHRPATVADLESACRALDWLVVEKVDGEWPEWATDPDRADYHHPNFWRRHLDALAEAQPFPPAGGS